MLGLVQFASASLKALWINVASVSLPSIDVDGLRVGLDDPDISSSEKCERKNTERKFEI